MKHLPRLNRALLALVIAPLIGLSARGGVLTTTVNVSNFDESGNYRFLNADGTPLSAGAAHVNRDGARVELGYFSAATTENPFAGEWRPLTAGATIGDSFDLAGLEAGWIAFSFFFDESSIVQVYDGGDPGAYQLEGGTARPADGQMLAVRFFGEAAGAESFNGVTSASWLWKAPNEAGESVTIDLAFSDLLWEDAENPLRATLAVPEVSTAGLLLLGAAGALVFGRRHRKWAR